MTVDSLALIKSLYYQPLLALAVFASILLPNRRDRTAAPVRSVV
jgi:hypothetical protein